MTVVKGNSRCRALAGSRAWQITVSSSPDQQARCSSSLPSSSSSYRSYPDPALHLALASRSFLVLCTFLRTAVLQRTLGSGSSSSPSHLSGCRADPQRLKAGDRAVQDCIYTSLTSVISHFAPRTRLEFVFQPYQTSNNRPPPRKSFHPPHIRRQSTSSPMSSTLFKRPTMLALAGAVTLMSFIPTAEAQYRRPYGYNTRRRGGW